MANQFDEIAVQFIDATQRVLAKANIRDIYWGFHFLLGAMTFTFAQKPAALMDFPGGLCCSSDLTTIHAKMVPFLSAGFRAICAAQADGAYSGMRADQLE